ncbi:uncharacterized protein EI90DRAFT_3072122 [Cantharellus anzutake]|uniref:uncharacterized protein n=1 Tax=Cantharellus anzutake TaxID=1750568 RepID=UPI0019067877|nr:uncharacterized protein EI90DRAFT_3072122 [Cantharellus anzutake]KAF8325887.1 hypothetical protein EI90DRAFT_3072122 [Cantharellus anzutake]
MDIVQGTSYALSLRWAVSGKVDKGGNYCVAQGVLEQFGDAGTALAAFSVAVLVVAYYHRVDWIVSNPRTVSWCLIISMVMILVILIVPPASVISHFYGNTGLWCWIAHSSPTNDRLQIGACYALMWLAALTSVFGYGYVLIGTLIGWNPSKVVTDSDIVLPTWTSKEAWGMFWYSLAYCIEVGPISIIRLVQFGSHGPCPSVKPGWTIFAISLLGASGLINTILWLTTKRGFGFSTEEERRRAIEAGRHS